MDRHDDFLFRKQKRQSRWIGALSDMFLVARGGIEPPTQGFSIFGSSSRAALKSGTQGSTRDTLIFSKKNSASLDHAERFGSGRITLMLSLLGLRKSISLWIATPLCRRLAICRRNISDLGAAFADQIVQTSVPDCAGRQHTKAGRYGIFSWRPCGWAAVATVNLTRCSRGFSRLSIDRRAYQ